MNMLEKHKVQEELYWKSMIINKIALDYNNKNKF
jgi:hypothetical protein